MAGGPEPRIPLPWDEPETPPSPGGNTQIPLPAQGGGRIPLPWDESQQPTPPPVPSTPVPFQAPQTQIPQTGTGQIPLPPQAGGELGPNMVELQTQDPSIWPPVNTEKFDKDPIIDVNADGVNKMSMWAAKGLAQALKKAEAQQLGVQVTPGAVSTWRTSSQQADLRARLGSRAAPAGQSLHERGYAVDMTELRPGDLDKFDAVMEQYGFARPWPDDPNEAHHYAWQPGLPADDPERVWKDDDPRMIEWQNNVDYAEPGSTRAMIYGLAGSRGWTKRDQSIAARMFLQESGMEAYNEDGSLKRSWAGALGIGQMLPETAAPYLAKRNLTAKDYAENPQVQIDVALEHLDNLLKKYDGSWAKALAAYNGGPGAVAYAQEKGVFPRSNSPDSWWAQTLPYVADILGVQPSQAMGWIAGDGGPKARTDKLKPQMEREELRHQVNNWMNWLMPEEGTYNKLIQEHEAAKKAGQTKPTAWDVLLTDMMEGGRAYARGATAGLALMAASVQERQKSGKPLLPISPDSDFDLAWMITQSPIFHESVPWKELAEMTRPTDWHSDAYAELNNMRGGQDFFQWAATAFPGGKSAEFTMDAALANLGSLGMEIPTLAGALATSLLLGPETYSGGALTNGLLGTGLARGSGLTGMVTAPGQMILEFGKKVPALSKAFGQMTPEFAEQLAAYSAIGGMMMMSEGIAESLHAGDSLQMAAAKGTAQAMLGFTAGMALPFALPTARLGAKKGLEWVGRGGQAYLEATGRIPKNYPWQAAAQKAVTDWFVQLDKGFTRSGPFSPGWLTRRVHKLALVGQELRERLIQESGRQSTARMLAERATKFREAGKNFARVVAQRVGEVQGVRQKIQVVRGHLQKFAQDHPMAVQQFDTINQAYELALRARRAVTPPPGARMDPAQMEAHMAKYSDILEASGAETAEEFLAAGGKGQAFRKKVEGSFKELLVDNGLVHPLEAGKKAGKADIGAFEGYRKLRAEEPKLQEQMEVMLGDDVLVNRKEYARTASAYEHMANVMDRQREYLLSKPGGWLFQKVKYDPVVMLGDGEIPELAQASLRYWQEAIDDTLNSRVNFAAIDDQIGFENTRLTRAVLDAQNIDPKAQYDQVIFSTRQKKLDTEAKLKHTKRLRPKSDKAKKDKDKLVAQYERDLKTYQKQLDDFDAARNELFGPTPPVKSNPRELEMERPQWEELASPQRTEADIVPRKAAEIHETLYGEKAHPWTKFLHKHIRGTDPIVEAKKWYANLAPDQRTELLYNELRNITEMWMDSVLPSRARLKQVGMDPDPEMGYKTVLDPNGATTSEVGTIESFLPAQLFKIMQAVFTQKEGVLSTVDDSFKYVKPEDARMMVESVEEFMKLRHPASIGEVMQRTEDVFRTMTHQATYADQIGTSMAKMWDEMLQGLDKTLTTPQGKMKPDIAKKLVSAIEAMAEDPKKMTELLKQYPTLREPLGNYLGVVRMLERYKVSSPDLHQYFRDSVVFHIFPKLQAVMKRGATQNSKIRGTRIGSEMRRKIQNLDEAEKLYNEAVKSVTGGGADWAWRGRRQPSTVRQKIDAFLDTTQENRARVLGIDPEDPQLNKKIGQVVMHLGLGNPVIDPGEIMKQQISTVFKMDAMRTAWRSLSQLHIPNTMHGDSPIYALMHIPQGPPPRVPTTRTGRTRPDVDVPGDPQGEYMVSLTDERTFGLDPNTQIEFGGTSVKAGELYLHPDIADHFKKFFAVDGSPGASEVLAAGELLRLPQLTGSPFPHFFNILTDHWMALSQKALGTIQDSLSRFARIPATAEGVMAAPRIIRETGRGIAEGALDWASAPMDALGLMVLGRKMEGHPEYLADAVLHGLELRVYNNMVRSAQEETVKLVSNEDPSLAPPPTGFFGRATEKVQNASELFREKLGMEGFVGGLKKMATQPGQRLEGAKQTAEALTSGFVNSDYLVNQWGLYRPIQQATLAAYHYWTAVHWRAMGEKMIAGGMRPDMALRMVKQEAAQYVNTLSGMVPHYKKIMMGSTDLDQTLYGNPTLGPLGAVINAKTPGWLRAKIDMVLSASGKSLWNVRNPQYADWLKSQWRRTLTYGLASAMVTKELFQFFMNGTGAVAAVLTGENIRESLQYADNDPKNLNTIQVGPNTKITWPFFGALRDAVRSAGGVMDTSELFKVFTNQVNSLPVALGEIAFNTDVMRSGKPIYIEDRSLDPTMKARQLADIAGHIGKREFGTLTEEVMGFENYPGFLSGRRPVAEWIGAFVGVQVSHNNPVMQEVGRNVVLEKQWQEKLEDRAVVPLRNWVRYKDPKYLEETVKILVKGQQVDGEALDPRWVGVFPGGMYFMSPEAVTNMVARELEPYGYSMSTLPPDMQHIVHKQVENYRRMLYESHFIQALQHIEKHNKRPSATETNQKMKELETR